jgi:uncharacterized protein (TIGR00288 family)
MEHDDKEMAMSDRKRIALLIDCDNSRYNAIEGVLEELSKIGVINVRHAHGDWNGPQLKGWMEQLHPHAIRPIQQFAYTKGKNATDAAMIIDAMDLLYSNNVDAFALMTSDSDFTPLVLRILEFGLPVYGFGEQKTPEPFVDACSTFIFTENLVAQSEENKEQKPPARKTPAQLRQDAALVKLLRTAVDQTSGDDDWAGLGAVGQYISNTSPFHPKNYGYTKLSDLVKASGLFDVEMRGGKSMFIKSKPPGQKARKK